ncbi:MAG: protein kinase, partial [Myxococcales bacterium]|nr:protein kinase [Myxococcales bacterium]
GGMGVVYAAHDPQLDRTIALKVLHPHSQRADAKERMLREAQAMARLRHPNVITVFDSGTHNGQVFIAMEFVEGGTLREWLEREPRPWREVLETLTQAGRGLAAAHDVGLVHRDFKPANALIDRDGRVLVSDFGLARGGAEPTPRPLPAAAMERTDIGDAREDLLRATLTRTGALIGTPAYMSPEQFARDLASPRSDQFAFCVVVYEALFGQRPFAGDEIGALVANIERGALRKPTRRRGVPSAVLSVLTRGLSVDPEARYASMHELLRALERAARPRGARRLLAVGLGGLALAGGSMFLDAPSRPEPETAPVNAGALSCEQRAEQQIERLSDEQRELVRAAMIASLGEAEGGARFEALEDTLRRYSTQLEKAQAARCTQRETRPESYGAASMVDVCLDDRRESLSAFLAAVVARVDEREKSILTSEPPRSIVAAGVDHADAAAEQLPSLTACELAHVQRAFREETGGAWSRRLAWSARLALAGALRPHPLTRPPHLDRDALEELAYTKRGGADTQRQLVLDAELALQVLEVQHDRPMDREATRAAYGAFASIATRAARAGMQETRARAWTLAAELLEAGDHSDAAFEQAITEGAMALDALPRAHTLQAPLRRDLGALALIHLGHGADADACVRTRDNEACRGAFQAVNILRAIPNSVDELERDNTRPELDAGLHALAMLRVDPGAVAEQARARAQAVELSAFGFLDFSARRTVSALSMPAFSLESEARRLEGASASTRVACTEELCRLERELVDEILKDPERYLEATRMIPLLRDGVRLGFKLYGLREGSILKLLRFKNGDTITAIDGVPLTDDDAVREADGPVQRALRGDAFTLTVVRKGETMARRFEIVAAARASA